MDEERLCSLAHRLQQGYRAFHDFFERDFRRADPHAVHERIRSEYDLTRAHAHLLERTALRASRAQGIVSYLEDRFGVDEQGEFADPQGLYSVVIRTKRPLKRLRAYSHGLAVQFEKGIWRHKNCGGFVDGSEPVLFDQLSVPLEQTLERLEQGKTNAVAHCSFSTPGPAHLKKQASRRYNQVREEAGWYRAMMLGLCSKRSLKELIQYEVTQHELRHIHDHVMGLKPSYKEFVATLYSQKTIFRDALTASFLIPPERGLERDLMNLAHSPGTRDTERLRDSSHSVISLLGETPRSQYPLISYAFSLTDGLGIRYGSLEPYVQLLSEPLGSSSGSC